MLLHSLLLNFRTLEILCLQARDWHLTERIRANFSPLWIYKTLSSFLLRDRANINLENHQKVTHSSIEQTPILISNTQKKNKLSTIKKVTKKSHWPFKIKDLTHNQIYFTLSQYAYAIQIYTRHLIYIFFKIFILIFLYLIQKTS